MNTVSKVVVMGFAVTFSANAISAPSAPTLNSPYNGQSGLSTSAVNFSWYPTGYNPTYRIVISQDANFSRFVDNGGSSSCSSDCFTATTTSTSYAKPMSCSGHTYYWKVRANDYTGASSWSTVRSFKTAGSTDSCPAKTTPLASSYMNNIVQGFGGLNSSFGGYHTGYDIATAYSKPSVYAVDNGTVVWNSTSSTKYTTAFSKYFNAFVVIKHDSGFYAYYGHLSSSLRVNSRISKGSVIGSIRDAYNSSNGLDSRNNHLHISISTGSNWVTSGWGYQTSTSGLARFVDPRTYIGL